MNALNGLDIRTEEGCVIHLILEQNAGYLVADEVRGVVLVVAGHEIVVLQTTSHDGELKISPVAKVSKLLKTLGG